MIAALGVKHLRLRRNMPSDAFQRRDVFRRRAGIVAQQDLLLIRIGANNRHAIQVLGQREQAVVLEQNHRSAGHSPSQLPVLLAIVAFVGDLRVGNPFRRIEHPQAEPRGH